MDTWFIRSPKFLAWRDELTTRLAWAATLLSLPVMFLSLQPGENESWEVYVTIAVFLGIAVIGLIHSGKPTLRAVAIVVLFLVPACMITYSYGVAGGGRLYLATAVVLAGTLLGAVVGTVTFLLTLLYIALVASLMIADPTLGAPEAADLNSRLDWWVWFAASYTLTTGVSLFVVIFLLQRVMRGIDIETARTDELEKSNLALTKLQERFELLEANISDVIWIMDLEMNYSYISPSVEKLRGYSQEEIMAIAPDNLTSETDLRIWKSYIQEGLKLDESSDDPERSRLFDSRVSHKDGHLVEVEVRARFLRNEKGEPIGIVGVTREISERMQLENMMDAVLRGTARSQGVDFFESLVTSLADVLQVDVVLVGELSEGRVRTRAVYNQGEVAENIEYDLAGTPCEQVALDGICSYPWDVQQQFPEDFLLQDMNTNSYIGAALRSHHGNPIGIIAALHSARIPDIPLAEKLLGIFGNHAAAEILRQNEQHEKELISHQLQRMQRIESIGLLAGGVAHDFNNLLVVISGYLELLELQESVDDKTSTALREMRAATDRATGLTRQLLTFSRRQVMEMKSVDINEMLKGLGNLFQQLLTANIDYVFKPGTSSATVHGDVSQLEQAIMNLVVNSRDAMPDGGRLSIEVGRESIDEEYVDSHPWAEVGDYVTISVEDSGIGMSEDVQERIFEPFFTTKEVDQGTGLGMSVYFGVIKQHGGFTQIYSELNHGTRVLTYLPANEAEVDEGTSSTQTDMMFGSEFILLVEDNEQVRTLNERILVQKGYRVVTAEDGDAAMEQYRRHRNDLSLIVLDVVLPKENGDQIMQRIRDGGDQVPILFTSGYAPGGIHTQFVLNESLEFIQKPFKPSELLHKIREMLDEHS